MQYIAISIVSFLIDFLIKTKKISKKDMNYYEEILGGKVILRRNHNSGAFLNILETKPVLLKIFLCLSFVFLFGLYYFALGKEGRVLLKTGVALIAGGAVGNLVDRIRNGFVIDYFSFKGLKKIVFNLSDMFIFLGILLVLTDEII